jgi:repressor LexA
MKRLTARQKEILEFIARSIEDMGYPPTVREVAERFKISVKGSYDHIKALEKKGQIECGPGRSRAIRIVSPNGARPEVKQVPLLGTVAAGRPLFAEENFEGAVAVPASLLGASKGRYFALRVRGDSMSGAGILSGDVAIIRHQATADSGEIVVAMVDEAVTLKRLFLEKNRIQLRAENEMFPQIYTQDARILGRLACIVRQYT